MEVQNMQKPNNSEDVPCSDSLINETSTETGPDAEVELSGPNLLPLLTLTMLLVIALIIWVNYFWTTHH